ncbi:PLP-dependent aminotransferase family protein [Thiohalorhabdus methylotrophus]|uniref:PLP-dependent aminotransferase family protein n=1 Tax=Thiohalorhabdus methylotrophus TaxID=3242694 RepID=A0ABV4TVC3_9GAMM
MPQKETRYQQVALELGHQIEQGVYQPGEKLPGVRRLARQFGVSVNTTLHALEQLEGEGRLTARPRAGFYVKAATTPIREPRSTETQGHPQAVTGQELVLRLAWAASRPGIAQLGTAVPHPSFLPVEAIEQAHGAARRRGGAGLQTYEFPPGHFELRRHIARRMMDAGCPVDPDEVVITSGCQEAIMLALDAVTEPGDIVAIESPAFYGLLQGIEAQGLQALEIPGDPETGISLEALQLAVEQWPIKAVAAVTNFSNPLGGTIPADRKKRLVRLLAERGAVLIEDDIYGELGYEGERPTAAKAYDEQGSVIYCSSFSKTVAPGLRIGWAVPGRNLDLLNFGKFATNQAAPSYPQRALAHFLAEGQLERYLRGIRGRYQTHVARAIEAIRRRFPAEVRVSQPRGGFVIWVELPEDVDALQLHETALGQGVSIAPGPIFSPSQKFRNCLRLNCAQPWEDILEPALERIGALLRSGAS